jgi:hypothetical protein
MTTGTPQSRGRLYLVQLGVSALIGIISLVALRELSDERGAVFWVVLAVAVLSAAEVVWFLVRYLRLARDR